MADRRQHTRGRSNWTLPLAAALLTAPLAACGSTSAPAHGGGVVRVEAPADRPAPTAADLTTTAAGTTAFGLDLLHALTATGTDRTGNLAISPSGLATALAMVLPGARGRTATELSATLHTRLTAEQYAVAMGALAHPTAAPAAAPTSGAPAAPAAPTSPKADQLTLNQSDTVWGQQGFGIQQDYLKVLAGAFDAGIRTTDFRADPEGSRKAVNALVEQQTAGRIKNLFGPGGINPDTRLALTDALYLKADWAHPFKPHDTSDAAFHQLDGSTTQVSTMNQSARLRYAAGTGWQAVELPYAGGTVAMDLLVPDSGNFEAYRKNLDAAALTAALGGLADRPVELAVPRFTFDSGHDLNDALKGLGTVAAFDPQQADLSGIPTDSKERLSISTVVQKAEIAVDEKGTVAAAGSGVGIGATAAQAPQPDAVKLDIDRPFLFLIRDLHSGQPLFLGQVTVPKR